MKEELTREIIEEVSCCEGDCYECLALKHCYHGGNLMQKLATALLEEMDKPKVWDGAPEDALQAQIIWFTKNGGYIGMKTYTRELPKTYTRELPKTRARIMAEEIASAKISNEKDLVDIIEQTINTHMKELKGEE